MRVLVEYVRRAPHDFTLYTRRTETGGLLELDPRVQVRRFPLSEPGGAAANLLDLARLPRRGRELAQEIDAGGHAVAFVHMSARVQAPEILPYLRTPSLYYAPEPIRAFSEPAPDFARDTSLRARLAERGLNPYEALRKRIDARDIHAADLVVTHSRYTASELARVHGVRAEVVHLGVDAEAFAPPTVPPPRERTVLAVGALHPLKGHQFVIEALATIEAERRPPLVVVGDRGDAAQPLRDLARRFGVELRLESGLSFAELVGLYHRAGALACGQIREPFGLITLEGMAAGLPVVAVAEGGFEESVRDGETGLLTPRDPRAFAAALLRALDEPALAGSLRETGLREAREVWTWERTVAGFDALLTRLATAGRR